MSSNVENKIITYLSGAGWSTTKDICANTAHKHGTIAVLLNKLESENTIVSKPNPAVHSGKLYKLNGIKSGFMADFNRLLSSVRSSDAANLVRP